MSGRPSPGRAIEAGLVAAVVSSAPGLLWVFVAGEPWWRAVQLVATLVGIEQVDRFDSLAFAVGGVMHVAISIALAIAFDRALAAGLRGRAPSNVAFTGLGGLFGALVYLVNFELAAALGMYDELRAGTNDAVEFVAHVLYGMTVGWWLARPRPGPA